MKLRVVGLKPPEMDVPLIELQADDGTWVDLFNECVLRAVVIDRAGLAFDFVETDGRALRLRFGDIRGLHVEQPVDWMPEEAEQIEHLVIRREGPWPRVDFKAGGMRYEFDARELSLVRSGNSVASREVS